MFNKLNRLVKPHYTVFHIVDFGFSSLGGIVALVYADKSVRRRNEVQNDNAKNVKKIN